VLHHPFIVLPLKRKVMEIFSRNGLLIILLLFVSGAVQTYGETKTCPRKKSPCFLKKMKCPAECPTSSSKDPKAKVCIVNCDSPICKAQCKSKTIVIFHCIFIRFIVIVLLLNIKYQFGLECCYC
jgi:hypothetical protein